MGFRRARGEFVLRQAHARQRRRLQRERLRGPRFFAGHVALRNRALLHAEDRLARHAVEHEQQAHLGDLRHRRDASCRSRSTSISAGGAGHIVIEDVVVHDLVIPAQLARWASSATTQLA